MNLVSTHIPTSEGINPLSFTRDYFTRLTDREIEILIGATIFLKEIRISLLMRLLNLSKFEVEEKLGRLQQTDLFEGTFTKDSFNLQQINYHILRQETELSIQEKGILTYLKARFTTSINELEKIFELNYESVIHYISIFITRGMISAEFNDDKTFNVIVYYQLPKKEPEEITNTEKIIVGYVKLYQHIPFSQLVSDLELSSSMVQEILNNLILSDIIVCNFVLETSKFKVENVKIQIRNFSIAFRKRNLSQMNASERIIIGVISLQNGIRVKSLQDLLKTSKKEILNTISLLNATKDFEFKIQKKSFITPISTPMIYANSSIETLETGNLINHRSLLGMLKAKPVIQISEISSKMNNKDVQIIRGIVDLYFHGLINGRLINLKTFKLENIRNKGEDYVTFEDWEKIIIGGLLSENRLAMGRIGQLLDISDKTEIREKALSFTARNIGNTSISNTLLSLNSEVKIPPLLQLSNLDLVNQQLYSYIVANKIVNTRSLQSLFDMNSNEIFQRLYFIVGSGLLTVNVQKGNISLKQSQKFYPVERIESLDYDLRMLILKIEEEKKFPIRLNSLAKKLNWSKDEVNLDISYLIAHGYYNGKINKGKFHKTSDLFQFKDKPKCFECNFELLDYREACPNCHSKPPSCSVCRSALNSADKIVLCPHCANTSHENHMIDWLKIKGVCPICRNNINNNELTYLSNQTS